MRRSAASLYEAGNDVSQAVAMITAANSVIQDPASVGTALKTVSMRIRGFGLGVDDASESLAKLESMFNNVGLTIYENEDTFKSTYQIFDELAEIWDNLSDTQQALMTERIAGKRQGKLYCPLY